MSTLLFKKISFIGNAITTLIGFLVLLGYVIQNQTLKSIFPGLVAMNPATALTFLIGSLSFFFFSQEKTHRVLFRVGFICALFVVFIGAFKLGSIVIVRDVYFDSHLFVHQLNAEVLITGRVNRMAPTTALSFFFVGVSLCLLYVRKKERLAQFLLLIVFFIALFAILGYLYGVKNLTGFVNYIPMAVNTAAAFFVFSLALLFSRQTHGLMYTITSENASGILIRKLIPATILVPSLLGYFCLMAERADIVTNELGLSLVIVFNIIIFILLIWWIATALNTLTVKLHESYLYLEDRVRERTVELEKKTEEMEHVLKDLEKFKLAVDNVSDQIIITDQAATVLYINKATERITGYTVTEVVGKKAGKLWGNLMKKSFYQNLWKTIAVDKKVFVGEITNQRKNKEMYTALISISPIFDTHGEIEFFVGIERDITREKEIDKVKSEFISVASHQLRTPLTGIKWFCELLMSQKVGKLSAKQMNYLSQVDESNERMIRLINELLDVSHIETGLKFAIEKKTSNIIDVIRKVIKDEAINFPMKKMNITLDISCPAQLVLDFDQDKIYQVFSNLINNSIKYSGTHKKIIVGLKQLNDQVQFFVKDFGYGIPEKQKNRVFQKFFRADNIATISTDGSGLGLYIAKGIVEAHGGTMWFESEEGNGAIFYFTLPLKIS